MHSSRARFFGEILEGRNIVDTDGGMFVIEKSIVLRERLTDDKNIFGAIFSCDLIFRITIYTQIGCSGVFENTCNLFDAMSICIGFEYRENSIKWLKRLEETIII